MHKPTLIIGNKNYSSWSLRPWFLLRHTGIDFDEIQISLGGPDARAQILRYSPSGKVPVLKDGAVTVWDSLAIAEYVAEQQPQLQLWPKDVAARATARAVSAEMHSGFGALRENMTQNCRKFLPGKGRAPGVAEDIARITTLWTECRERFGADGEFLFGQFSIADAMYAPVVLRFRTYAVELDPVCARYAQNILTLPAIEAWVAQASAETEVLPQFER
ncbi:MAG: glutathione S-transferase family protein [Gammaproteobacteria bacterium]